MVQKYLFFDFDGMKFDTLPAQIEYINNRYSINTTEPDHVGNNNNLDKIVTTHRPDLLLTRDEIYNDFGVNFISSIEAHEQVQPMKDMPRVVKELSRKFTLMVVTGRQKRGIHVIQHLLRKHAPGCISYVHCVWGYSEEKGFFGVQKRDFIQKIDGEKSGFFDDSVHEIEDTKDVVPSYLFDPKNIHKEIMDINKVYSWQEIGGMFL